MPRLASQVNGDLTSTDSIDKVSIKSATESLISSVALTKIA